MLYSIITPTYKRSSELLRCAESVISQLSDTDDYSIEMIIINDSPEYDYSEYENNPVSTSPIIRYFKNENNMGSNYCKNLALSKVYPASDYVIYLDDDDWLAANAIKDINNTLSAHRHKWLVTNRVLADDTKLTENRTGRSVINYFLDYLGAKRFRGDATHIISTDIAKRATFPSHVKNGEEWYYFCQMPSHFVYADLDTTVTNGYSNTGLTEDLKSKYKSNTAPLWREKLNMKIVIYLIYRSVTRIVK